MGQEKKEEQFINRNVLLFSIFELEKFSFLASTNAHLVIWTGLQAKNMIIRNN